MRQPAAREHVVMRGESLSTIAGKYRLASWKALYDAPCNDELRRKRPSPRLIQPGDRVRIPPDARELARARLQHLRALRLETEKTFDRIQRQLRNEYRSVVGLGKTVDTFAMLAQGITNIAGMIKDSHRMMSLAGAELEKANRSLVRTHVVNATDRFVGIAANEGAFDVTGDEWEMWAYGKILIKSWYDMTSPSYWAGVITKWRTGQTPQEAFEQALQHLETTRIGALHQLDRRIRETERLLGAASMPAPPMH